MRLRRFASLTDACSRTPRGHRATTTAAANADVPLNGRLLRHHRCRCATESSRSRPPHPDAVRRWDGRLGGHRPRAGSRPPAGRGPAHGTALLERWRRPHVHDAAPKRLLPGMGRQQSRDAACATAPGAKATAGSTRRGSVAGLLLSRRSRTLVGHIEPAQDTRVSSIATARPVRTALLLRYRPMATTIRASVRSARWQACCSPLASRTSSSAGSVSSR